MKRTEREILAALDIAGPKSHAAKIYEVIARGRIDPMPFAQFYALLDRMAREPDGMVSEMIMRNRRVFWLTRNGRRELDERGNRHEAV